jgi:hypothetical protein
MSSQLTRLEVNKILPAVGLGGLGVLVASGSETGVSAGAAVGSGVSVGGGGASVAGIGVSVGAGVSVGGTGVSVGGMGVSVGGIGVSVGGRGVSVGGTGVSVGGIGVSVGGTGVSVAAWTTSVGGSGVAVGSVLQAPSTNASSSIAATKQYHLLLWLKDFIICPFPPWLPQGTTDTIEITYGEIS